MNLCIFIFSGCIIKGRTISSIHVVTNQWFTRLFCIFLTVVVGVGGGGYMRVYIHVKFVCWQS